MSKIIIAYGETSITRLEEIDNIVEHVPSGTTGYITLVSYDPIEQNRAFHEAIYSIVQSGFDGRIMADAPQPNGLQIRRAKTLDKLERERYGFNADEPVCAVVIVKYIAGRKYIPSKFEKVDDVWRIPFSK